jgi:hypothetical protein
MSGDSEYTSAKDFLAKIDSGDLDGNLMVEVWRLTGAMSWYAF